jgi:Copper amine oxidase N-terminal domain.
MKVWLIVSPVFVAICGLMWLKQLGGQTMSEEQAMKMMKEFVALAPGEVPGFETGNGIVERVNTKWGLVNIRLLQRLYREETKGSKTLIKIWANLLPNRDSAYEAAVLFTTTQRAPIGQPGMPEGSWSGLPIGEKAWSTVPKQIGEAPVAHLTVWDDQLAIHVSVEYHLPSRWIEFVPIDRSDLELGELAARLIIAKANLILLGWHELLKVRLVANGRELEARKEKNGRAYVPVQALMDAMGGKFERRHGLVTVSWAGKKVTMPIGAREIIVGKERVKLFLPILWDGKELWVEGKGIAKGLGLALRWEKGKMVLARK